MGIIILIWNNYFAWKGYSQFKLIQASLFLQCHGDWITKGVPWWGLSPYSRVSTHRYYRFVRWVERRVTSDHCEVGYSNNNVLVLMSPQQENLWGLWCHGKYSSNREPWGVWFNKRTMVCMVHQENHGVCGSTREPWGCMVRQENPGAVRFNKRTLGLMVGSTREPWGVWFNKRTTWGTYGSERNTYSGRLCLCNSDTPCPQ